MLQSKEHIGQLDRRITIQEPVYEINPISNERTITGWSDVAAVWAKVHDNTGSENYQAEQIEAVRGTMFTIRFREVDVTWRISFDGDYYNIQSVERPDRKGFLKVLGFIGTDYGDAET